MNIIRVLLSKAGLDGHDRGVKVVARGLRGAGMEVIYMGLYKTPEEIVEAAIQEDVDVVGLSLLSGAHMTIVSKIVDGLKKHHVEGILILVGGIVPEDDASELTEMGVDKVFGPGTSISEIVEFIEKNVGGK